MDVTELSGQLSCSRSEKLACMETVRTLREMADAVQTEGLTILPRLAPEDDLFFCTCVEVVLEQDRRDLAKTVLKGYLLAEERTGGDLLRRVLIVHGLLLILDRTEPELLTYALQGWFGADFRREYRAGLQAEEPQRPRIRSLWPDFDELSHASMPFLIRLTFELNANTLATALVGAGDEVQDRLLSAISTREKLESIRSLMDSLEHTRPMEVEDAQRWICEYSRKLMDQCPEF